MSIKQITVISGKGGAGKTTFVSSLAVLMKNKVIVDCDVDASNLHLILGLKKLKKKERFISRRKYSIDKDKCVQCGKCISYCRFNAITDDYIIDPFSCEHCGICERICPIDAVVVQPRELGQLYVSDTRYGILVHAELYAGEENSGKLVNMVRGKAKEYVQNGSKDYILIDGPPGVGCPVISSVTGVDLIVVVTEPSMSGLHDLKRVLELADYFKIKTAVVINKYDINIENSKLIEKFCEEQSIEIIGRIPYDKRIVDSIVNGIPPIVKADKKEYNEFVKAYNKIETILTSI